MKAVFVQHRVNTSQQLASMSNLASGCEIDIRSHSSRNGKLILSHDPWSEGEALETWLESYKNKNLIGPLILNTKEDGLESRILELLRQNKIENFFFLDTCLPTLVKWTKQNSEKRFAVRFSAFEPKEFCLKFQDLADWLWVDCFNAQPQNVDLDLFSKFKVCLVSPELQSGSSEQIPLFKHLANHAKAICTKTPDLWKA
jgi:hypothetical protein